MRGTAQKDDAVLFYATVLKPSHLEVYRPARISLAVDISVHPVQAVCTDLPVRTRLSTELPAELHLPGRECGITASPALRVIGRSHRAGDATYNMGDRAFAVAAPRAWDSLPNAIRHSPYTTAEHRVPELILVLGSHIAGDINPALGCHYFPPGR